MHHGPDSLPRPTAGAWPLLAAAPVATGAMAVCALWASWLPGMVAAGLCQGAIVLLAWWRNRLTVGQVLGIAVLMRVLVFWLPPGISDDGWRYAWDGLVQAHGFSPYAHAPAGPELQVLHGSRALAEMNSADLFTVYPPLSQGLFLLGGLIERAGAPTLASIYLIKAMLAGAELCGVMLLARLVTPRALLLYAWHPLVVLESAGQAHTESLLVLLLVLCIFAITRARPRLAGAALGAAVMVKLYPLVLLPFLWRRLGWPSCWPAVVVMAALALPYASLEAAEHVTQSLSLYVTRFEFNALPYFVTRDLANWIHPGGENLGPILVGRMLQALFLALVPLLLWLDWRRAWSLDRAFGLVLGAYFICSTTVHPWYLLGLLALPWTLGEPIAPPRRQRPHEATALAARWPGMIQWQWLALGLLSLGTYIRYLKTDAAEAAYFGFVWIGWCAWLVLLLAPGTPLILQAILRRRGWRKAALIAPHIPIGARVLDLGAGEGYVAKALAEQRQGRGVLCDVVNLRRVDLPHVRYDGRCLPFPAKSFDAVVLYYVLHHADDPAAVLGEALRVGRGVIVVESVYRRRWERLLLERLDRMANRLRSIGAVTLQDQLDLRPSQAWRDLARRLGAEEVAFDEFGTPPHRQVLMVLRQAVSGRP